MVKPVLEKSFAGPEEQNLLARSWAFREFFARSPRTRRDQGNGSARLGFPIGIPRWMPGERKRKSTALIGPLFEGKARSRREHATGKEETVLSLRGYARVPTAARSGAEASERAGTSLLASGRDPPVLSKWCRVGLYLSRRIGACSTFKGSEAASLAASLVREAGRTCWSPWHGVPVPRAHMDGFQ